MTEKTSPKMFAIIRRDGETVEVVTENENGAGALAWFHKNHSFSMDWAIRYEGYTVDTYAV